MSDPDQTATAGRRPRVISPWTDRIVAGNAVGGTLAPPAWLQDSYKQFRDAVMHPEFPCFFGTQAEQRGEMFYGFIENNDLSELAATMRSFVRLSLERENQKNNFAVFFAPDPAIGPGTHEMFRDLCWRVLQYLHANDTDPQVMEQPDPDDPAWEFSFAGMEMFVVGCSPSYVRRRSRNIGPGVVLLFQPRSVFIDAMTQRELGMDVRGAVRRRLEKWDGMAPHPDLGVFGDRANREWKQYFLDDANIADKGRCPFHARRPAATIPSLLRERAEKHPERVAIRHLRDGERDEDTLDCRSLHRQVSALAHELATLAAPGDRAMLLLPTGLDFVVAFLACLRAGIVAVPAYKLDGSTKQQRDRLLAMAEDCTPSLLLTDSDDATAIAGLSGRLHMVRRVESEQDQLPQTSPDSVAFLQYTSGSTAAPKGVMVTHANIAANEQAIAAAMGFTATDTMVSWLPLFHDMGLIGGLLAPLWNDFLLVLMSPQHFFERPLRWLEAIAHYRGTVGGGPDFAFGLCVDRIPESRLAGLDLSSWRVAFCGAEPIRGGTMDAFRARFAPAQLDPGALFPCYGLAESTLLVSGGPPGGGAASIRFDRAGLARGIASPDLDGAALVDCGAVPSGLTVRIVDPVDGAPCSAARIGEIWVSGDSVATGYWNNAETTKAVFGARLADAPGKRFLRTGDLGMLMDGRLFVTGRLKDLLILRGQNLSPQDVEQAIGDDVPLLRKGRVAVFPVTDTHGREAIGLAAELSRMTLKQLGGAEIARQIAAAVANRFGEPVQLILLLQPGDLPRTTSGKLRRSACLEAWRDGALVPAFVADRAIGSPTQMPLPLETATERALADLWSETLGVSVSSTEEDFLRLGGQSLDGVRLLAAIADRFGALPPLRFLFEHSTLGDQARAIDALVAAGPGCADESVAGDSALPLIGAQAGFWVADAMDPESRANTLSGGLHLRGMLDVRRLRSALSRLAARHDALRTTYVATDGVPTQRVLDEPAVAWSVIEGADPEQRRRQMLATPFALPHGPMLRAELIVLAPDHHVLLLATHHIAVDAWSATVLLRDLLLIYADRPLPLLPLSYAQAVRHRHLLPDEQAAQIARWSDMLSGEQPDLRLPFEPASDTVGDAVGLAVPAGLVQAMRAAARAEGATLFMLMLAGFDLLLSRWSGGERDVRVGVPLAGRSMPGSAELVGCFVNTVVIRSLLSPQASVAALIAQVRSRVLDADALQDLPFDRLVVALNPARAGSGNPLFQAMFNLYRDPADLLPTITGLDIAPLAITPGPAQFLLALNAIERGEGLFLSFEFPSVGHARDYVERMAQDYLVILRQIVADLGVAQGNVVLEAGIGPCAGAGSRSVLEAIAEQAALHPTDEAVLCNNVAIDRATLENWSNAIAARLRAEGVGAEDRVGLFVSRSVALPAALLGIWKAGAAFVPLDPTHPPARLAFMIEDSAIQHVVADPDDTARLNELRAGLTTISAARGDAPAEPAALDPRQLAYVLYTSGSTGMPKGVAIDHRALSRHLHDFIATHRIDAGEVMLQSSTINFDVFLHELLPALMQGGRVVMRGPDAWTLDLLSQTLADQRVSFSRIPTALWQQWIGAAPAELPALRQITVGGEELPGDALRSWQSGPLAYVPVDNLYGPTETTIACLHHRTSVADAGSAVVSIGSPYPSRTAAILDPDGNPVPDGVAGELCIGGDTLARGYLGRPGLTAERFVPHPNDPGARLYRTGDLCRRGPDGNILFLGRLDAQIKLRGHRIEPGEIEAALRAQAGVEAAAVCVKGEGELRRLIAYVVGDADTDGLREELTRTLPAHMVPSTFVSLPALPLLPSGKLDRVTLPEPELIDAARIRTAPRNETESRLLAIWRQVLRRDDLDIHDDFFQAGGDSILSLQIVSRAASVGLTLSPSALFGHPTVARAAAVARVADEPVRVAAETHEPLPLTPIQARFFARQPETPISWCQHVCVRLDSVITADRVAAALHRLVERHDALRLRFARDADGEWRQAVSPRETATLLHQLPSSDARAEDARIATLTGAIDPCRGPMLQASFVEPHDGTAGELLLAIHHLAVDGVSWRILLDNLTRDFATDPIAAPATTPWSVWARALAEHADSDAVRGELAWWQAHLSDVAADPRLPPVGVDRIGDSVERTWHLDENTTACLLRNVPHSSRLRTDELLLSALVTSLTAWSGTPAVLVDVESHGRGNPPSGLAIDGTVGWFTTRHPVLLPGGEREVDTLSAVRQTLRSVPNGGLSWGLLQYHPDQAIRDAVHALPAPLVGFNYLGDLDRAVVEAAQLSLLSAGATLDPESPLPYALDLNAQIKDGILSVTWRHMSVIDADTLDTLVARFEQALRTLIAAGTAGAITPLASDFPVAGLDQAALDAIGPKLAGIDDIVAATELQAGLLGFGLQGAHDPYHVQHVFALDGTLDVDALAASWTRLRGRHAILRADFAWQGLDRPVLLIRPETPVELQCRDWSALDTDACAGALRADWDEARSRRFDFERAGTLDLLLITLSDRKHWLVWRFHHAQLDGWSLAAILSELMTGYDAIVAGRPFVLPPVAEWSEHVRLLSARDETQALQRLGDMLGDMALPTRLPLPAINHAGGAQHAEQTVSLTADEQVALDSFGRRNGLTTATLLQGAWALTLGSNADLGSVLFGVTVSGRSALPGNAADTVGLLINTLPLRVDLAPAQPTLDWLRAIQDRAVSLRDAEHLPARRIAEAAGRRADESLFDSVLVFENYPLDARLRESSGALHISHVADAAGRTGQDGVRVTDGRNHYPLSLVVVPGNTLSLTIAYRQAKFDAPGIRKLLQQLRDILAVFAHDASRPLGMLFERPPAPHSVIALPEPENDLAARVVSHARERPDAVAIRDAHGTIDWRTLWDRAGVLASALAAAGVGRETPVAVLLPRDRTQVIALLAIWRAGGIYVPLDPEAPADRLRWQLGDCGASVLVTENDTAWRDSVAHVIPPDATVGRAVAPDIRRHPDNGATLIYTSGSTGRPKGVSVPHRALTAYVASMARRLPDGIASAAHVSTMAADLGQTTLFGALWSGWTLFLLDADHAADPDRLADAMQRHPADVLKITPSHLGALLFAADPARLLPRRCLVLGGEAASPALLQRVRALAPELVVLNHYGPTETAIGALTHRVFDTMPLGQPLEHALVRLLDRNGAPVPEGQAGEICIGGAGLARFYANRPGLTAERFVPDADGLPGARLYRTGDRARRDANGDMVFLHRGDDQVKIRGFRVEPEETASVLRAQPGVRDAAVIVDRADDATPRLLAFVAGDGLDADALLSALTRVLPAAFVPSHIEILETLPLTRNGKIDRAALARPRAPAPITRTAPTDPTETAMLLIWRSVLKREAIGTDENFFAAGGDSILSLQVLAKCRQAGYRLTPKQFFDNPTIAAAARIAKHVPAKPAPMPAITRLDPASFGFDPAKITAIHPATPLQQGMLFHTLLQSGGTYYVSERRLTLEGPLEVERFRAAWAEAHRQHDILRTFFDWRSAEAVMQCVRRETPHPFTVLDWRETATYEADLSNWREQQVSVPFDLAAAPLYRLFLFRRPDGAHDLLWFSHHILLDGWSTAQLVAEVFERYRVATPIDRPAPPDAALYTDWLARRGTSESWWRDRLDGLGEPPMLTKALLPPRVVGNAAGQREIRLDAALADALRSTARTDAITLNTLVQGAWALLLSRHTGAGKAVFGVTMAGRPTDLPGAETMLGLFINTLPAIVAVPERLGRRDWLQQLQREQTILREHEATPLADIQRWAGQPGQALFDTLLVFENYPIDAALRAPDALPRIASIESANRTHYPLTLVVTPHDDGAIELVWDWDGTFFDERTIARTELRLIEILEQLARGGNEALHRIEFGASDAYAPRCFPFEPATTRITRRAASAPDAIALCCGEERWSRDALERWSNSIALALREAGVGPETPVGLCVGRSGALVAAMLGILKAGGAFVPLDPAYPADRLRWIAANAGLGIIVADESSVSRHPGLLDGRLLVSSAACVVEDVVASWPAPHPEQLAYVIHTSGSTGRPKAVGLSHRNLARLLDTTETPFGFGDADVWTLFHSYAFDFSVWEIFGSLCSGGRLVVVPQEVPRDSAAFHALLRRERVTVLNQTPSAFLPLARIDLSEPLETLRVVILGGERFEPETLSDWIAARGIGRTADAPTLANMYGITETTVHTTLHMVGSDDVGDTAAARSPIGVALPDLSLVVRDGTLRPLPDGAVGELHVGGDGLARGYLGQPGLTAERFVPDPNGPPGSRLYRSGDLGRRLPDATFDHAGRADRQVKIRGFRIEPGEIESVLLSIPEVREASVLAVADEDGGRLAAFVVSPHGAALVALLREALQERLPAHMVPASLHVLDAMPLTGNNKRDEAALLRMAPGLDAVAWTAPATDMEMLVGEVWQAVLKRDRIGRDDDFFALGGHSLSAIRATARLAERLGTDVKLALLFTYPTVRDLAAHLPNNAAATGSGSDALAMMEDWLDELA